jgi:hypothetical protein
MKTIQLEDRNKWHNRGNRQRNITSSRPANRMTYLRVEYVAMIEDTRK